MNNQNSENREPSRQKGMPQEIPTVKIGELLVREGFLKEEDVQTALAVQRKEALLTKQPLGQILIKMGLISDADLDHLLNHHELRRLIGIMALERGYVNEDQLKSCLRRQAPGQLIGEVFINEGLIGPDQLQDLLREQMNAPRLGELAVNMDLLSEADLEKALKVQKGIRFLGEILCDLKLIHPVDLYYVLNKYSKQFKLGEILLKQGHIDRASLNRALKDQKKGFDSLGEVLLRQKLITSEQLQQALSQQSNLPFSRLEKFVYSEQDKKILSAIISEKYAERNLMIPISLDRRHLTLAVVRPENIQNARDLKALYNYERISCLLITEETFNELFDVLYGKRLGTVRSDEGPGAASGLQGVDFMELELDEDMERAGEGPVQGVKDIEAEELVNFIIKYGVSQGASDIHLEQDLEGVKLRYRIDGVLHDVNKGWLKSKIQEKAGAVISRIKIMSNLDIAEKRLPQDGGFRITYFDKAKRKKFDLDFRVATCKAITGENVNVRILDPRKANVGLEMLYHSSHVLEPFRMMLRGSAGMILVSGPTGSGKTTTLYAALKYIYNPLIKIITAEDPIEYNFPGIMQAQVNPKINLTFARLLRSFLRMDPDVILIGEIRDEETAKISFDATQTGHLLLSTIHTNDSVSSVSRLLDLNVERSQIASSLTCVLAQRLIRKICTSCIRECIPDRNEWSVLFDRFPSHLRFHEGKGCEVCGFTGYRGRTLISEIFIVDSDISNALSKGQEVEQIRRMAIEKGMKTLLDDGLLKLDETTLSEIIRAVSYDMIQEFRARSRERMEGYPSTGELPEDPDSRFLIWDPRQQDDILNRMCRRYEFLASFDPSRNQKMDRDVFMEFVSESFGDVCREYRCDQVIFNIDSREGKTEISAIPAPRERG